MNTTLVFLATLFLATTHAYGYDRLMRVSYDEPTDQGVTETSIQIVTFGNEGESITKIVIPLEGRHIERYIRVDSEDTVDVHTTGLNLTVAYTDNGRGPGAPQSITIR